MSIVGERNQPRNLHLERLRSQLCGLRDQLGALLFEVLRGLH